MVPHLTTCLLGDLAILATRDQGHTRTAGETGTESGPGS